MRNKFIGFLSVLFIIIGAALGIYQWYLEKTFSKLSLAILIVGILGAIIPMFVKNKYEKKYVANDWEHDVNGWFLKISKKEHGISNPKINYYELDNGIYEHVICEVSVTQNDDCIVRVNHRRDCKIVIS